MFGLLTAVAFAPLFGFFDRWSGGGFGWEKLKDKLPGRPIYYVALAVLAVYAVLAAPLILAGGTLASILPAFVFAVTDFPALAVATVAFLVWRSPAWGFLGGTTTPRNNKQLWRTFLRHLIVLVPLIGAFMLGLANFAALLMGVAFAAIATIMAGQYADDVDSGRDTNHEVELKRGVVFGIMMGIALAIPF